MERGERTLEGLARPKPSFEGIRARMSERIPSWKHGHDVGGGSKIPESLIASCEPAEESGKDAA